MQQNRRHFAPAVLVIRALELELKFQALTLAPDPGI